MTEPQLVATAWTSAGDTSPMRTPATSPVPIAERIAAIADAGFCGFGLIADDLVAVRDSIGFAALRDLIAERGLVHTEIELLERWWIPRGEPGTHLRGPRPAVRGRRRARPGVHQDRLGERARRRRTRLALAAPLRELAEQAAAHGTRVAIETMPFSAIATVPMGAEIVAAAEHPAAGLLVDAWHVFRAGTTPGRTPHRAAAGDDLRRRTRRRRTRCRRHARSRTPSTTGCSAAKALST